MTKRQPRAPFSEVLSRRAKTPDEVAQKPDVSAARVPQRSHRPSSVATPLGRVRGDNPSSEEGRRSAELGALVATGAEPRDRYSVRTCRDAVLDAFTRLERRHGRMVFQLEDIVAETRANDPQYKETTVRTHVTSRMCINAPDNHASVYGDLLRVDRGMYRRR